jgi:hypothetical protein
MKSQLTHFKSMLKRLYQNQEQYNNIELSSALNDIKTFFINLNEDSFISFFARVKLKDILKENYYTELLTLIEKYEK